MAYYMGVGHAMSKPTQLMLNMCVVYSKCDGKCYTLRNRIPSPDARLTRSWAIDVSLVLFLPSIGTYLLKVGSEGKPQTQASTLKSSHRTTFHTLSIVKSDANGGQGRFSCGFCCIF